MYANVTQKLCNVCLLCCILPQITVIFYIILCYALYILGLLLRFFEITFCLLTNQITHEILLPKKYFIVLRKTLGK